MSDSSLTATAKAADRLQHEEKRYNVFYLKFSNKDATSRISMKNIMASENVTGKQVYRREWVFFFRFYRSDCIAALSFPLSQSQLFFFSSLSQHEHFIIYIHTTLPFIDKTFHFSFTRDREYEMGKSKNGSEKTKQTHIIIYRNT